MAMGGTLAPDALGRENGEVAPTAIQSESEVAPTEIDSESDEATPVLDGVEESHEPNSSHPAANSHPPSEPSASDDTLFRLWDEEPTLVDPFVAVSAASPVLQAPLAPWVWPSEANVAEELRPMWRERKERAAAAQVGDIVFSAAQDLEASLRGIVRQGCAAFYVGATVDPLRRWLGDEGMEQFGLGQGWQGDAGGHARAHLHLASHEGLRLVRRRRRAEPRSFFDRFRQGAVEGGKSKRRLGCSGRFGFHAGVYICCVEVVSRDKKQQKNDA